MLTVAVTMTRRVLVTMTDNVDGLVEFLSRRPTHVIHGDEVLSMLTKW